MNEFYRYQNIGKPEDPSIFRKIWRSVKVIMDTTEKSFSIIVSTIFLMHLINSTKTDGTTEEHRNLSIEHNRTMIQNQPHTYLLNDRDEKGYIESNHGEWD